MKFRILHHRYCPVSLMISTSLATMHVHFVLPLLHVGSNRLTISSSHHRGGLSSSRFRSLGYHTATARVHLLYMNLVTCNSQRNSCFRYLSISFFTPFPNHLASDVFMQHIPIIDLSKDSCVIISLCYSHFVVAQISLVFDIVINTVMRNNLYNNF